ncbi:MAG TPA: hypothetical protein VFE13_06755 [Caulobacteraceae bacterium]|jgi:uncharacterized protein YjbJ (UPF0337 family)|nr:hypothetical protein [Caulobacteraceae bacterium]
MSDELEGRINNGIGKVEAEAGEVMGDPGLKLQGEARQFEGSAQETLGEVKDKLGKTARKARTVVTDAAGQASEAYETLRKQALEIHDTVDPFVRERPYAAVLAASLVGFVLGALFFASPKVIYVKPARV